MSRRSYIRIPLLLGALWVVAGAGLPDSLAAGGPSPAGSLRTECELLEQGPDRTVVRIRAGGGRQRFTSFALAVPGPDRPDVRLLSEDSVTLPGVHEGLPDSGERVVAVEPGLYRDVWTSTIHVALEWVDESGRPRRARELVIAVEHPSGLPSLPVPPATQAPDRSSGMFLNSTVAESFRQVTAAARRAVLVEDTFARSPNWLRVEVADGGLYSLDYAELRTALGSVVDLVDPSSIRLFSARRRVQPVFPSGAGSSWALETGLAERAIRVEAAEPTLVPGDRILMFLPGVAGWSDEYDGSAAWLSHEENTFATRHAFWISFDLAGSTPGDFPALPLRMASVDASPVGTPDRILDDVRVRARLEENIEPGFGNTPDNWMWASFIGVDESRIFGFSAPGAVADSVVWLRTRPTMDINGAKRADGTQVNFFSAGYELTGTTIGTVDWAFSQQRSPGGYWWSTAATGIQDGANTIRVRNLAEAGANGRDPLLYVDGLTLHWRARLEPGATGQLDWVIPSNEAQAGRWRFRMRDPASGLDAAVLVDVTDPWRPRWIEPGAGRLSGSSVDFDLAVADSARMSFRFSTDAGLRTPLRIEQRRPALIRAAVRQPDLSPGDGYKYVVLTAPEFRSAAEDLADLRRQELEGSSGARVTVADLQDVYDQFGHGAKDPSAIRNYIKFLHEVDPRLRFVALMGDANRDSREILPNSTRDYCPTWIESAWPFIPGSGGSRNDGLVPFARDDWFGCLDDPRIRPSDFDLDLPDIAVGRFPVNSSTEAARMVRRIRDYELAPEAGTWKNSILLAADDEIGGNGNWETYHIGEAEVVSENFLPRAMDRRKLYLTEYDNVGSARSKPAARIDFINEWTEGRAIVHYIGHGSPQQLSDEVLFRIEDISSLRNGMRLPLFLAFSCDVAIFDDPTTQSMSEALVLSPSGGALVAMAATYVTFVGPNEDLTDAFYARLYPSTPGSLVARETLGRSAAVGQAMLEAKNIGMPTVSGFREENDSRYVTLGDPAARIQSPEQDVNLVGDMSTRILTAQREQLVGGTRTLDTGEWYMLAAESADSVRYPRPDGLATLDYVLSGNSFFNGRGSFSAGRAEVELRTPTVMRMGQNGRVRLLMEEGGEMRVGLAEPIPVEAGSLVSSDVEGPAISFQDLRPDVPVRPGEDLVAVIQDSSGVNVLGSVAASSILAEFDDAGVSVDFTDRFVLDDGSYTRGTVRITLPSDLAEGSHSLTLSAGDMIGNVTLQRVELGVVDEIANGIQRHAPFPNPFSSSTRFVVEVASSVPGPIDISLDLYTVAGAHVNGFSTISDGTGRVIFPWAGTDRTGDAIANGTYLYVIRARFPGTAPRTETATGRVVLMR